MSDRMKQSYETDGQKVYFSIEAAADSTGDALVATNAYGPGGYEVEGRLTQKELHRALRDALLLRGAKADARTKP